MPGIMLQAIRQNSSSMRRFAPSMIRPMSTTVTPSIIPMLTPVTPIAEVAEATVAAEAAEAVEAAEGEADLPKSIIPSQVPIVPNNEVVSQLINTLMRDGKKARAQRLVSDSMKQLAQKLEPNTDPYTVLLDAIETASPLLKLTSQKKGSKVVHVPTALKDTQRRRRAIVWMMDAAAKRGEKSFKERFASEVYDVSQGTSSVLQKKQQIHKQALANRANAQVSYNTQR